MELSGPKLKKFVIFLQKTFCYVLGNVNFLKKLLTFQEIEFLALRLKDFLYFLKTFFFMFWKTKLFKKAFYILGGNFPSSKFFLKKRP